LAIKKTQMFVLLLKFMFILITVRTNKIDAYKEPVGESNLVPNLLGVNAIYPLLFPTHRITHCNFLFVCSCKPLH